MSVCFATHTRSILIRGCTCPQTPIRFNMIKKMGAAATYCFARLLVARANRAVTLFAVLHHLSHPFHRFLPCSLQSYLLALTPQSIFYPKQKPSFTYSIHCVTFRSFILALAFPVTSVCEAKNPPALRQSRWHPKPSLRSVLPSFATLAPLAVGSRLSTTLAKKQLRYRSACFLPLRSGSGLLYLFSI